MFNRSLKILLVLLGMVLVTGLGIVFSSAAEPCEYDAKTYEGLELAQLSRTLEKTGLVGRMHGAAASSQLFVLSVRDPRSFFSHREFSLLPENDAVRETLSQVRRHDQVCIQGSFIDNPSPQKHVTVTAAKILEKWSGLEDFPAYEREADLPAELENQTSFVGKVHAIGAEGEILVVEYKDGVLPIFVETPEETAGLFRGDIVRLAYQIQKWPEQPTHLQLDAEAEQPIEVLEAIATRHEQEETLVGKLVKFPQSPQLKFDVYAIEVETQGVNRTFTLINFDDLETFEAIREKLASLWDQHLDTAISGRNMLINPEVMVEARGRINVISPEQANPQILLESVESLKILNPV